MPLDIDRFTPQHTFEPRALDPRREASEQHFRHRHFVDDRVEPFDEQKLKVRRLAFHLDRSLQLDLAMRDNCGQRLRRLFKRLSCCRTKAPYANVRVVRKMLPSCFTLS